MNSRLQILHRPTFDTRAIIAPLLLNLVALGSLYCETQSARMKGESLWSLAHKGVASAVRKALRFAIIVELRLGFCEVGEAHAASRSIRPNTWSAAGPHCYLGTNVCFPFT